MDLYSPVIVETLSFALNDVLRNRDTLFEQLNYTLGMYIYKHVFHLYLQQRPLHVKINLIGYEISNTTLLIYYQLVSEYESITNTHEELNEFMKEVYTVLKNFSYP